MRRSLTAPECIATIAVSLRRAGAATPTVGGTIGFRVHGLGGGDWIVDLGQSGGAWSQPADSHAIAACTVTVYAEAEALARLVLDPRNVDTDLRSGVLAVDGDTRRLTLLGRLLRSSGSALSLRLPRSASSPNP